MSESWNTLQPTKSDDVSEISSQVHIHSGDHEDPVDLRDAARSDDAQIQGTTSNHNRPSLPPQRQQTPQNEAPLPPPYLETILALALTVLIAIVIVIYVKKDNMSNYQKHIFETLTTGLLLFLGLCVAVSTCISALPRYGDRLMTGIFTGRV